VGKFQTLSIVIPGSSCDSGEPKQIADASLASPQVAADFSARGVSCRVRQPTDLIRCLAQLMLYSVFAVIGSMAIGVLPEAGFERILHGNRLEALMPGLTIAALFLGYAVAPKLPIPGIARWIWIPWLLWFFVGLQELSRTWSPSWDYHTTRWQYAYDNLLPPTAACSGTECMYVLFFTAPLFCSIAFSVGVAIAVKRAGKQ